MALATYGTSFAVMRAMIQLVLCYGHSEFTRTCIRSIYTHTPAEEINLVVWENGSPDLLKDDDVDPRNTVLLRMDQNYGCSTALNALLKDFGAALDQDVIYISNDHVVFPRWIEPLLDNPQGFHAISPMHPYGLPDLHARLSRLADFKDGLRGKYLDHPESTARIDEYLHRIYGADLDRFIQEKIRPLPEVALEGQFWAGCFWLRKDILENVGLFRTDRGLACDEDVLWVDENIRGRYREGVYSRCYMHHFQSITTNRFGLTMDHARDEFSRGPTPAMSDVARETVSRGVQAMRSILARGV
jgi:GT2 family glycosyltransferase